MPLKKIKREKHTKQALFLCDVSPVSFLGALLKREREARQGRHGDFHVEPGEKASRSALGSVQICRARVVFCVMRSANIGNGGHNPGRKRRRVSIHPETSTCKQRVRPSHGWVCSWICSWVCSWVKARVSSLKTFGVADVRNDRDALFCVARHAPFCRFFLHQGHYYFACRNAINIGNGGHNPGRKRRRVKHTPGNVDV